MALEAESQHPEFWNDNKRAQETMRKLADLKLSVEPWEVLEKEVADTLELAEMLKADGATEGDDARQVNEITEELAARHEKLEIQAILTDEADKLPCFLQIHCGAGGTESQDWAQMLLRMYVRWAERKGFEVSILDMLDGEEAGIKSVSIEIKGRYAYGFLKAEKGVHRLVRISPFDSQARRHTSFASVFVYPDIDDTIEVDLRDEDIKMDVYRASGAGGQHVNKTSSAVRLTHIPTGIVVACQQERSQGKNKATAYKMLRAALYQKQLEEQEAERAKLEATKTDNSWGNQIRSYVFQPYTMVNDHRTELKLTDVQAVMNGELDEFIEAFLKRHGGEAA